MIDDFKERLFNSIISSYTNASNKLLSDLNVINSKQILLSKSDIQRKKDRIVTLMRQNDSKISFIKSNFNSMYDVLYGAKREQLINIYNFTDYLDYHDFGLLDDATVCLNLSINKLPIIISRYYNSDTRFDYLNKMIMVSKPDLFREFDYTVYGFTDAGRFEPTAKRLSYIQSCSFKSLRSVANSEYKHKSDIANAIIKIIQDFCHQARIGTILHQILSFVWVRQKEPSSHYYNGFSKYITISDVSMSAVNTHSFQLIIRLLQGYDSMPFRIKQGKIRLDSDSNNDWFISLPDLLSTLVNGVFFELSGTLDNDSAIVYCNHLLYCARLGYVDTLLKLKSKMRKWTKLALSSSKHLALTTWVNDSPSEIKLSSGDNEYFFETEIDDLKNIIDNYPTYYKNWVNDNLKKIKSISGNELTIGINSTLLIRHFIISSHTITCPSIYYKTSPGAALEAAYGTKLNTDIKTPKKKKVVEVDGTQLVTDSYFEDLNDYNLEIGDAIKEMGQRGLNRDIFQKLDKLFVDFLTNKSGGVKLDPEDLHFMKLESEAEKMISSVSQTRIINFLLNSQRFNTLTGIKEMANTIVRCGIRQQIDRRQRVIMIKSNVGQLGEIAYLICFNKMKDIYPEIAMGKQTGNITDSYFQLSESGNPTSLTSSSDVSGMDASVLPYLAMFIRRKLLDGFLSSGMRFKHSFAFEDSELIVTYYDRNGNVTKKQKEMVNGLEILIYFIENVTGSEELRLKDGYFAKEFLASKFTFPSGKFFTSGNHTILLAKLMEYLKDFAGKYQIDLNSRILGDDIIFNLYGWQKNQIYDKIFNKFKELASCYNLKVDVDVSRFTGGFLQQHVLCGLYVPLCARSSIFNVEKTETDPRNPTEAIYIFMETLHIAINRTYSQSNAVPLLHSIWFVTRCKHYYYKKAINGINLSGYPGKLLTQLNESLYITLPMMFVSVAPMNFPPLILRYTKQRQVPLSILTPQGDFMYNYWFYVFHNQGFIISIKEEGIGRSFDQRCFTGMIDWELRNKNGITLSEHLNEFKRNMSLSKQRQEQLGKQTLVVMRNTLMEYTNNEKRFEVNVAKQILQANGVSVPYSLTPEGIHEKKILDSFASKLETLDESTIIDELYLKHLTEYKKLPYHKMKKFLFNTATCDFMINYENFTNPAKENDKWYKFRSASTNLLLPLQPCSHMHSDLSYILMVTGFPSQHDKIQKSLTRIKEEVSFGFDVSVAIDFVLSVMKTNANLKDEAIKFLGLSDSLSSKFSELVDALFRDGEPITYQSIFQYSKYFMSSGVGDLFLERFRINAQYVDVLDSKVRLYYQLLARDFLYAYGLKLGYGDAIISSYYTQLAMIAREEEISRLS